MSSASRPAVPSRHLIALLVAALPVACASPPAAEPDLRGAACGNGTVDAGEECDDGNTSNADSCLVSCYAPARFVASDPHVHGRGCLEAPASPPRLASLLAAEGIEVGAALVWGDGFDEEHPFFTGADNPAATGGRILHYDLEVSAFAAGDTGHLLMLGLRDIDFSGDPFRSPRTGLDLPAWARAQGERVAVGMAHGQFWPANGFPSPPVACCMPWEFPIQAVRGGVSFLVTERRIDGPPVDPGTFQLWRTLLNAGYRIAIMGGSDFPCIHRELSGAPRTDVIVNGPLTYDAWLEGVRRGRTVITLDGAHRLNLRVNGAPLGSEVAARANEVLLVSIENEAPEPTGVEVLVNGGTVASVVLPAGRQVATLRMPIGQSAWIAARTLRAATSPVYVVVDGRPVRGPAADICYLKQYTDHLSSLVSSRRIDLGDETGHALAAYAAAGAEFARRFGEAGGGVCP
jgi:cysteine-rich repeat protein